MEVTSERNPAEGPEASGGVGHEPAFSNEIRTVNLALQGGGAHGAFTWGVLDRLLDEKDLAFEGLSATSAGAMNGRSLPMGLRSTVAKGRAKRSQATGSASAMQPGWGRCSPTPSTECWGIIN